MTDDSESEPAAGGPGAPPAQSEDADRQDADGDRRPDADDGGQPDTDAGRDPDDDTGGEPEAGTGGRGDAGAPEQRDAVGHPEDASRADAGSEPATDATGASAGTDAVDDPSEIDPSELTVSQRSLNPRIRIVWICRAVLTALIAGGLAHLADRYVFGVGVVVPAGVTAALLVLGVAHALVRYRVWSYEVREDALYLERGVVTRVRTVVPFVRIQHVDTSRGPIERATGLATSVVYTAGSRGADVTIPGLEADRADDLQHRLKRLAIASEADTAV